MKKKNEMVELAVETKDGTFVATYSEKGLCGLEFPNGRTRKGNGAMPSAQIKKWHGQTTQALKGALRGEVARALPPIDLSAGTEFQKSVWRTLRTISAGRTLSYGEVAKKIGKPRAVRAVGGACGANPIPVLVPCHRVLAANRRIGGFSGGLDWKRRLLEREGAKDFTLALGA